MDELSGATIAMTGATGQVGKPLALSLAKENEVIAIARFSDAEARSELEDAGITCVVADLGACDIGDTPDDVDYFLHFGVLKTGNWDIDFTGNADAVFALMHRMRTAQAVLVCSTTAVYAKAPGVILKEDAQLGDSHSPSLPTYSMTKIGAEAVARAAARHLELPTTIARLNVPYGDNGGWPGWHLEFMKRGIPVPTHPVSNLYCPIHEDDMLAHIPRLLGVASVPATILNWGGEPATTEEWVAIMEELTGLEATFAPSEDAIPGVAPDTTRMKELIGPTTVSLREGIERMVAARFQPA